MPQPARMTATLKRNQWVIDAQSDGLSHIDSLRQLPFRGNCLNWVLGHLAVERDKLAVALGLPAALDPDTSSRYDRGSEPITGLEAAVPLDRLLTTLARQQEQIVAALERAAPETLAAVFDPERGTTVLDWVEFLIWHETYHLGQLEILRQLAGRDDAII